LTRRVLVVDDYEPWRRHVRSVLERIPSWQIAGEAADGQAAVQSARELKPDLILMDIGLPILNGIRAAQQIMADNPAAAILFVTEQPSSDIADAALRTGARGYIFKSDAARELLPAMDAVVDGKRFITARLEGKTP
jgi:DNA-binding NarL/FixJ family response regulator